jgi:hypothetical protein
MIQILKYLNQIVAFLLELAMFFSLSYWGYNKGNNLFLKWTFAIVMLLITITLWAIFAAPKSDTRLVFPVRLIFELSLFLLASLAIYKLNYTNYALLFALIAVLSVGLAFVFRQ